MFKLTFAQWLAAVTAATGKTRARLEARDGWQCMEYVYNNTHLTVEQAVEHYTSEDTMYRKIDIAMGRAYEVQLQCKQAGVHITWDEAYASIQAEVVGEDVSMRRVL